MKGVIVDCLAKMVTEKFGRDKWTESLVKTGLPATSLFLSTEDFDDDMVLRLLESACQVLSISPEQAANFFGEYWVNVYAPKVYRPYYRGFHSAKDYILKMDSVHRQATKSIKNARPPQFEYEWKDPRTLIMRYKSHRGLIDILVGLLKGVGIYFKENLQVRKIGGNAVEIVFPK